MVLDLMWVNEMLSSGGGLDAAAGVIKIAKASRASKIGAKSTKLFRVLRLIRILRLYKTASKRFSKENENDKIAVAKKNKSLNGK